MIKETIALLGHKATDKVTGFSGVITSVSFDLYGCVNLIVNPPAEPGKDLTGGNWFDPQRLEISEEQVMKAPDFDASGKIPATYDNGPTIKPVRTV